MYNNYNSTQPIYTHSTLLLTLYAQYRRILDSSYSRAIVSIGPLFPHLWLVWHRQLVPLLGGRPHNTPNHIGTVLKLVRWV